MGPSARTREGGTARTLAGSVRCDDIHYTRPRDPGYSAVNGLPRITRYTGSLLGFPEPCGHPGLQPSPKHFLEGCVLRNETTAPVPVSTTCYSVVAVASDTDFEVRWAAWRRRGVAHERAVRRKLMLVAAFAGALAAAVVIAYTLLQP